MPTVNPTHSHPAGPDTQQRLGTTRWLIKLRALLAARRLDQQLAFGFPASWSPLLAARTEQLQARRVGLARTLESLVRKAQDPRQVLLLKGRWGAKLPVARDLVLAVQNELLQLATRLRAPDAPARGVALVFCLLRDLDSSLFTGRRLHETIDEAVAALGQPDDDGRARALAA